MTALDVRAVLVDLLTDDVMERLYQAAQNGRTGVYWAMRDVLLDHARLAHQPPPAEGETSCDCEVYQTCAKCATREAEPPAPEPRRIEMVEEVVDGERRFVNAASPERATPPLAPLPPITPTCGHNYLDAGDDGPVEVTCRFKEGHSGPHGQWPDQPAPTPERLAPMLTDGMTDDLIAEYRDLALEMDTPPWANLP